MQLGDQGPRGEALSDAGVGAPLAATRKQPRGGGRGTFGEERAAYLFLIPWFAGFVFFLLIPLLCAVWLSFTDEQLLRPGRFIGFDNYVTAFTDDPSFYKALSVTLTWIVIAVPL